MNAKQAENNLKD